MIQTPTITWEEANQRYLMRALAELRIELESFLLHPDHDDAKTAGGKAREHGRHDAVTEMEFPPAIEVLCESFGLSSFERKILLMCAGSEFDSHLASLLAAAGKDLPYQPPAFSLAMAAFNDAHWSALLPTRPLRYWRLVEAGAGSTLTTSPLRIDERILHYLAGIASLDERVRSLTRPAPTGGQLAASQRETAAQVAACWAESGRDSELPVLELCGGDRSSRQAIAAAACELLGLGMRVLQDSVVPSASDELELLARLWEREARLGPVVLLVAFDEKESADAHNSAAAVRLIESLHAPVLISARERRRLGDRAVFFFNVDKPTSQEQAKTWRAALGEAASTLNGKVDAVVSQFDMSEAEIHATAARVLSLNSSSPKAAGCAQANVAERLWSACRQQVRPVMEGMAQRITSPAMWDDLVLPQKQKQLLRQIAIQVRQRGKVYQSWGFASKDTRGLGISALFAGPSGTGKTMAGEVLANELGLDLYRIDLSQVISKYIGETEKNLRRVFDAAEGGAAILLFDEADALFGKRSEVKDSHDRYANIEVSYLLQRIEAYRGLAVLTTNRRDALDTAFLRRIRFIVDFPFPEAAQRAEIWRRVFPAQTPVEDLRMERLARLNAAGGNIRNIALSAAFLAADAGEPVRMAHLLSAARTEFAKLEQPLTDAETAGWV